MRVSIRDTDVLRVNGGLDLVNCTIIRITEGNWLFNEGAEGAPDYCIRVRNDFDVNTRRTRDVVIQSLVTNAEMGTNPDAAFLDISPNIGSNATVLIAGCTLQGDDPVYPFALGDETEITAYTDNGDGTITCSTPFTGSFADGDWINILRTENYNGGHEISNVVANTSFDITATYVDNPGRGTAHSGSLDHRDPRIKTRDNIGITASFARCAMVEVGNAAVTSISTQDEWVKVEFDGLVDGKPFTERFALCGPGLLAEFVYQGRDDIKGYCDVQLRMRADGQGNLESDFEFAFGLNGADPTNIFPFSVKQVNGIDIRDFSFRQVFQLSTGDFLSLYVRCTDGTRDVLVEDIAIGARQA